VKVEIPASHRGRADVGRSTAAASEAAVPVPHAQHDAMCDDHSGLSRREKRGPLYAAGGRVNRIRRVSLFVTSAVVLVVCLGSIALSVVGIVGRTSSLPDDVHESALPTRPVSGVIGHRLQTANGVSAADSDIQSGSSMN
jgi:hypothetical protein